MYNVEYHQSVTGNYYTDITIEESLKNKKSVWNETDSQAQSGQSKSSLGSYFLLAKFTPTS